MKCHIPQISWHNRDPVLSIDFQTTQDGIQRLATGGTDTHVLIWFVTITDDENVSVEFAADLTRHTKAVNIVRFSPNGEILASGDDEAAIILWKHQPNISHDIFAENENNKESWNALTFLRGHINDICDLCWSADSRFIISGSVDNTSIVWDTTRKGRNIGMLAEAKGFVQGVAYDPLGQYIATISSDRALRIYNANSLKPVYKVQKAILPSTLQTTDAPTKPERLFYDDTLKSFCRRLTFSPDGSILIVPSGIREELGGKISNTTYVFARNSLNKPVLCLPTGDNYTIAVRCCPVLFKLRISSKVGSIEENNQNLFSLPYRIIYAVGTCNSILLYDTQQTVPFAHIGNVHYTRLSDLTWSPDARMLMASSTDGYCSFIIFSDEELGQVYKSDIQVNTTNKDVLNKDAQEEIKIETRPIHNTDMDWTLVLEPSTADCQAFENKSLEPVEQEVAPQKETLPLSQGDKISESNKTPRRVQLITVAKKITENI